MALQRLIGQNQRYPDVPYSIVSAAVSGLLIDLTGEKVAMVGRVMYPDGATTKNIRKFAFPFGAVTKAGGSGLTGSLQDVSLTSGPPGQPDEVQDQTVAIANADANFASNTWYTTGNLSADRAVAKDALLAIVIEYDGGGRLGADSVVISSGSGTFGQNGINVLKTGGTWAINSSIPRAVLIADDGTVGFFYESFPFSALNQHNYNSGSVPDELAAIIKVPFKCSIDGLWAVATPFNNAACDFDLVLYSGTTVLASVSVDGNSVAGFNTFRVYDCGISEISLSPGVDYLVAVKPTTANSVQAYSYDFADASYADALSGGRNVRFTSRTDAGAWAAETSTRRLLAGVRICKLDDGVAPGGGLLVHPGMSGGMRG